MPWLQGVRLIRNTLRGSGQRGLSIARSSANSAAQAKARPPPRRRDIRSRHARTDDPLRQVACGPIPGERYCRLVTRGRGLRVHAPTAQHWRLPPSQTACSQSSGTWRRTGLLRTATHPHWTAKYCCGHLARDQRCRFKHPRTPLPGLNGHIARTTSGSTSPTTSNWGAWDQSTHQGRFGSAAPR